MVDQFALQVGYCWQLILPCHATNFLQYCAYEFIFWAEMLDHPHWLLKCRSPRNRDPGNLNYLDCLPMNLDPGNILRCFLFFLTFVLYILTLRLSYQSTYLLPLHDLIRQQYGLYSITIVTTLSSLTDFVKFYEITRNLWFFLEKFLSWRM